MELRYATITGVARDDLPDGGAWLYAETVRAIHELNPGTGVENLIPDFNGEPDLLAEVFESRPEVLAHNVETVPRIFKRIRPAFRYDRSLTCSPRPAPFGLVTKSNLILGMGETREEVSPGAARPARRRLRAGHDHPVPPPVAAPPPGRALGQARGVRRAGHRGRGDRLRRRDERSAGALVLPRRAALPQAMERRAAEPRLCEQSTWRTTRSRQARPPAHREDASRASTSRITQMRQVYRITKQADRSIGLILLGTFVVATLVAFALLSLIPPGWLASTCSPRCSSASWRRSSSSAAAPRRRRWRRSRASPGAALAVLSVLRAAGAPTR